jgi:tetratricopeptide (TPR) repeat protein
MTYPRLVRILILSTFALFLAALATPAYAQQGSLRGKVIDEAGKPVPDADVTLDFVGDYVRQFKAKTDKNGEWVKAGMPPGGGTWVITATKGDMSGVIKGVQVMIGAMTRTQDVTIKAGGAAKTAESAKLSQDEIDKRNKKQAELETLFNDANAASDAGNYDDANAKLTQMATEVPKCAACWAKMGDNYVKKSDGEKDKADARTADLQKAEEAYLKAIEIDPSQGGTYNALASVYNSEKKFDDAAKMSAKANELAGGAPGATGGGSAESIYNQGIIFWNQGKIPEAKAQFLKAIELDPKMADAQYWLGMALVNEGKLPEAKKPFEEYMKLAPTGQYAETAKAMLAMIK